MTDDNLTDAITTLATKLDSAEEPKESKLASFKTAFYELSDDEKKEARKALGEDPEDKKVAKKSNDDEEKQAKKSKKSMDEEDEKHQAKKSNDDEKDKKIASLTASLQKLTSEMVITKTKPIVDKMLKARSEAGMAQDELAKFEQSFYGKSVAEIQQRYNEDKALFGKASNPITEMATSESEIPFYEGEGSGALTAKTLEEVLK